MIDAKDKQILSLLLEDAAISKADIARQVGLAPSAISERVRRLEADGVIQGYEVRLNPHALGKPLLAFVFVTDAKPSLGFDTAAALSGVTGLEELHKIAGDDCYLLKIRASGTDELNEIIETQINPVQSVTRVRTTIVLSAVTERPCMAGHSI
ncbi:Lrp/AsnC family transcriptional regulator [Nioella aestuarii]|uniref:Lrp/AsnC family transcriptional regulator n=1 Tax=Nioella aestuarii TaxID=1662864 RepID=UPI003D7FDD00